jgi:hypothetical protein
MDGRVLTELREEAGLSFSSASAFNARLLCEAGSSWSATLSVSMVSFMFTHCNKHSMQSIEHSNADQHNIIVMSLSTGRQRIPYLLRGIGHLLVELVEFTIAVFSALLRSFLFLYLTALQLVAPAQSGLNCRVHRGSCYIPFTSQRTVLMHIARASCGNSIQRGCAMVEVTKSHEPVSWSGNWLQECL